MHIMKSTLQVMYIITCMFLVVHVCSLVCLVGKGERVRERERREREREREGRGEGEGVRRLSEKEE